MSNRAQQTITDLDGEVVIAKGDPIGYVHFPVEALTIILTISLTMRVAMVLKIKQILRIWLGLRL